jgi:hypothetical protein
VDEKRLDRDELARRRALRAQRTTGNLDPAREVDGEEDEIPRFTWGEIFAMIIAAYQVLLPFVLAVIGTMGALYLFFKYFFH